MRCPTLAGDPMSGLEAVMAARQSITLYDQISPEEFRDYYQNFGCGWLLPHPAAASSWLDCSWKRACAVGTCLRQSWRCQ